MSVVVVDYPWMRPDCDTIRSCRPAPPQKHKKPAPKPLASRTNARKPPAPKPTLPTPPHNRKPSPLLAANSLLAMPTDYHQAKAAREAAEALLALVSPGLRWAEGQQARTYLASLRQAEVEAYRVALNGALAKITNGKATSIERIYREVEV